MHVSARWQFALIHRVPAELRDVMVDFLWGRERLWALDLRVEPVAVEDLRWQLALRWWSFEDVPFAVSPDEVRADPWRYRAQHARTIAAGLSFPISVLARPHGVLTVLDGVHRLLKADLLDYETLPVKKLPMAQLERIACT